MKIPRKLCDNCKRFRYGVCMLADLEPCQPVLRDPDKKAKDTFLAVVTIIGLICVAVAILLACNRHKEEPVEEQEYVSAVAILRELHKNEITEWDKLVLAIAYTESRFRDDVVGKAGDSGILQITEPYVREANRISGANFKHEDAFSIDSSLAMFAAIQDYYNPSHGIDEAIYRHNKSEQYRRTVLENLEMINRYEALRAKLIMTHY